MCSAALGVFTWRYPEVGLHWSGFVGSGFLPGPLGLRPPCLFVFFCLALGDIHTTSMTVRPRRQHVLNVLVQALDVTSYSSRHPCSSPPLSFYFSLCICSGVLVILVCISGRPRRQRPSSASWGDCSWFSAGSRSRCTGDVPPRNHGR